MNSPAVARVTPIENEHEIQPDKLVSFTCSHVFENTRPVLLVVHEHGDWTFTCGCADHGTNDSHLVGVDYLVEQDPSLSGCLDIVEGFEAVRSWNGVPWLRGKIGEMALGALETETAPALEPHYLSDADATLEPILTLDP
ncbi:MAG: hypothetical protein ACREPT_03055 [Rudaea sp.]